MFLPKAANWRSPLPRIDDAALEQRAGPIVDDSVQGRPIGPELHRLDRLGCDARHPDADRRRGGGFVPSPG
jgi:hypothetical protein